MGDKINKNMKRIISKKVFINKAPLTICVFMFLGTGLFLYSYNQDLISNFKFYHSQSYQSYISTEIKSFGKNLNQFANVLNVFTEDKDIQLDPEKRELAQSIPILVYHGVIDMDDKTNTTLENFKDQMFALKKAGWQTISIYDYYDFIKGSKEFPDKSFLLTFDDGRKDSYYPVDPILKALDYNAVMFVITSRAEKSSFHLSLSELERVNKSGRWDIQSHGGDDHDLFAIDNLGNKDHYLSNKLWLQEENRQETTEEFRSRIFNDLTESKKWLENNYKKDIVGYAYPFSDYGQNSKNFIEEAPLIIDEVARKIYPMTFYQVWEGLGFAFNYPEQESFMMKRISVKPDWNGSKLIQVLENGRAKILPFQEDIFQSDGWVNTYGSSDLGFDELNLSATASTTGASVFLDGTKLWKDYFYTTDLDWTSGSHVSLIARYKDSKNYHVCTFGKDSTRIESVIDGKVKKLSEEKNFINVPDGKILLSVSVNDDFMECLIGKTVITYATIPKDEGGVGIKIWDKELGKASVSISGVKVDAIDQADNIKTSLPTYSPKEKITEKTTEPEKTVVEPKPGKKPSLEMTQLSASAIDAWKGSIASISFSGDKMSVNSDTYTKTAFVYVPGGYEWSNYEFMLDIKQILGSRASVIGRYADSKNYVTCDYIDRGSFAMLLQVINGKSSLVTSGSTNLTDPDLKDGYGSIGIQVSGNSVSCMRNGKTVIKAEVPTVPKQGTAGFKIYASTPGMAKLEIYKAKVTPVF